MSELWKSAAFKLTLAIGLAVSIIYVRFMWRALQRAVQTREDADVGSDLYRNSLVGAVFAVFGSAGAIALYGAAPVLLYLGPGLAVASALAVSYCLRIESRDE